jgi:hypothetical protein
MFTISKPLSAGQAHQYHANEFANAKENYYRRTRVRHMTNTGRSSRGSRIAARPSPWLDAARGLSIPPDGAVDMSHGRLPPPAQSWLISPRRPVQRHPVRTIWRCRQVALLLANVRCAPP